MTRTIETSGIALAREALMDMQRDAREREADRRKARKRYAELLNGAGEPAEPGELNFTIANLQPTLPELAAWIGRRGTIDGTLNPLELFDQAMLYEDAKTVAEMAKLVGEYAEAKEEFERLSAAESAAIAADRKRDEESALRPNIQPTRAIPAERRAARSRIGFLRRQTDELRDKIHRDWAQGGDRVFFALPMPIVNG